MTDDTPTPKPHLRREVVETLRFAEAEAESQRVQARVSSVPPARHNTDEPVDVVTALENMLRAHEEQEKRIAAEHAERMEMIEARSVSERAEMAGKIDALTETVARALDPDVGLPAILKEVAAQIVSPFLARDDERKRQVEALEKEVSELKTEVNAQLLNHSRFLAEQGRKIAELEAAIRELVGDGRGT